MLRSSLLLPTLTGCGILIQNHTINNENLTPISGAMNESILEEIISKFDSGIRNDLRTISIYECSCIDTASAHVGNPLNPFDFNPYITVSDYWDSLQIDLGAEQIPENNPSGPDLNDPVFSIEFKRKLIAHELLHIAQDKYNIDVLSFYEKVRGWYLNQETGIPSANGIYQGNFNGANRMKLTLWWNLYGQKGDPEQDDEWKLMAYSPRYSKSIRGVEEFAYIGSKILVEDEEWRRKDRILELTPEILDFYKGIINVEILNITEE